LIIHYKEWKDIFVDSTIVVVDLGPYYFLDVLFVALFPCCKLISLYVGVWTFCLLPFTGNQSVTFTYNNGYEYMTCIMCHVISLHFPWPFHHNIKHINKCCHLIIIHFLTHSSLRYPMKIQRCQLKWVMEGLLCEHVFVVDKITLVSTKPLNLCD
jgi:hypothetical protein